MILGIGHHVDPRDLVSREEEIARLYSPLRAIAEAQPRDRLAPLLSPCQAHKEQAWDFGAATKTWAPFLAAQVPEIGWAVSALAK
jgi:hypothetical protein